MNKLLPLLFASAAFLASPLHAQIAFAGDDFISAWSDPAHPNDPAIVLRVPKLEQHASTWGPTLEKLPVSPDDAIKMVFASDLARKTPKDWKLLRVQLSAMHPSLFSTLPVSDKPLSDTTLITYYLVDILRLSDGRSFSFMVLMNGKVYSPRLEKQTG